MKLYLWLGVLATLFLSSLMALWISSSAVFIGTSLLTVIGLFYAYHRLQARKDDHRFVQSYLRLSQGMDSRLLKTLWTTWVSQHYQHLRPLLNAMEPVDHTPHPSSRMLFMMGRYRPFRRHIVWRWEHGQLQWQEGSPLSAHGKLALTSCLKGFFDLNPLKVFQRRVQQDQIIIELKYHTTTSGGKGDFSLEMILKPQHGAWIVDGKLSQDPVSLYLQ